MNANIRNIRWVLVFATALLLVAGAFAAAACSGGANGSDAAPTATVAGDPDADVDSGADADPGVFGYLEAAPKDQLYQVQMTNFAFTPDVLEVNAEEVLEIAVQNVEPILHDFTIDKIDADVHVSYLEGNGMHGHPNPDIEADLHFALSEPGVGVVHLKVREPGEYIFYCTVPGHREAGMEGRLIVR